jgi:hypothetical protein
MFTEQCFSRTFTILRHFVHSATLCTFAMLNSFAQDFFFGMVSWRGWVGVRLVFRRSEYADVLLAKQISESIGLGGRIFPVM